MSKPLYNTDPFDEWFIEEKGSGIDYEIEGDVDECAEDFNFNDVDLY